MKITARTTIGDVAQTLDRVIRLADEARENLMTKWGATPAEADELRQWHQQDLAHWRADALAEISEWMRQTREQ